MSNLARPRQQRPALRIGVILGCVALVVLLLPIAIATYITIANDLAASRVKDQLLALPLPENSALVDSYSRAGKLVGNGNGMQYFGAIRIESDLPLAELEAFYAEQATILDQERESEYPLGISVLPSESSGMGEFHGATGFLVAPGKPNHYIVSMWGDAPSSFLENTDLRGH